MPDTSLEMIQKRWKILEKFRSIYVTGERGGRSKDLCEIEKEYLQWQMLSYNESRCKSEGERRAEEITWLESSFCHLRVFRDTKEQVGSAGGYCSACFCVAVAIPSWFAGVGGRAAWSYIANTCLKICKNLFTPYMWLWYDITDVWQGSFWPGGKGITFRRWRHGKPGESGACQKNEERGKSRWQRTIMMPGVLQS